MVKGVFKKEIWKDNDLVSPTGGTLALENLTKLVQQENLITEYLKSKIRLKNTKNRKSLKKVEQEKKIATQSAGKLVDLSIFHSSGVIKELPGTEAYIIALRRQYEQINIVRKAVKLPLLALPTFKKDISISPVVKSAAGDKSVKTDKSFVRKIKSPLFKKNMQTPRKRSNSLSKYLKKKVYCLRYSGVRLRIGGRLYTVLKRPPRQKIFLKHTTQLQKKVVFRGLTADKNATKLNAATITLQAPPGGQDGSALKQKFLNGVVEKSFKPRSDFVVNTDLIQNLVLEQRRFSKNKVIPPAILLSEWKAIGARTALIGNSFKRVEGLSELFALLKVGPQPGLLQEWFEVFKKIKNKYNLEDVLELAPFGQIAELWAKVDASKIKGAKKWKAQRMRYTRRLLKKVLQGKRAFLRIKKKRKKKKFLSLYYQKSLRILDTRLCYARQYSKISNFYFFKLIKNSFVSYYPRALSLGFDLAYFAKCLKISYFGIKVTENLLVRKPFTALNNCWAPSRRQKIFSSILLSTCQNKAKGLGWGLSTRRDNFWGQIFSLFAGRLRYATGAAVRKKTIICDERSSSVDPISNAALDESDDIIEVYNLLKGVVDLDRHYPYVSGDGASLGNLISITIDMNNLHYFEKLKTELDFDLKSKFINQMMEEGLTMFTNLDAENSSASLLEVYALNFYLYLKTSACAFVLKDYINIWCSSGAAGVLQKTDGQIRAWEALEKNLKKHLKCYSYLCAYGHLLGNIKLRVLKKAYTKFFFDFFSFYRKEAILLLRESIRKLVVKRRWVWPILWFSFRYRKRSAIKKKIKKLWLPPRIWQDFYLNKSAPEFMLPYFKSWKKLNYTGRRGKRKRRARRARRLTWFAPDIWEGLPAVLRALFKFMSFGKKSLFFKRKILSHRKSRLTQLDRGRLSRVFYKHILGDFRQKIRFFKSIRQNMWARAERRTRIWMWLKAARLKKIKIKKTDIWLSYYKLKRLRRKRLVLGLNLLSKKYSPTRWVVASSAEQERRLVNNCWVPPEEWVLIADAVRKKIVQNSYKRLMRRQALKIKFYRKFLWKRRNYKMLNSTAYKNWIKNKAIAASKYTEHLVYNRVRSINSKDKILNPFEKCNQITEELSPMVKTKDWSNNDKKQKY